MNTALSPPGTRTSLACQVTSRATLCCTLQELAELRRNPGSWQGQSWPPSLLKHSEEQTVAAVAVILKALKDRPERPGQFVDWGVVAAPTLFGRDATATALQRFESEGAWGISPHMIPHYTLHAASGTISQALKIQGPNFGISGGPDAPGEAFLVARALLEKNRVPGVWLLLTGYDREKFPRETNKEAPLHLEAVALALELGGEGMRLHIGPEQAERGWPEFSLTRFRSSLESERKPTRWRLPGTGWIGCEPAREAA